MVSPYSAEGVEGIRHTPIAHAVTHCDKEQEVEDVRGGGKEADGITSSGLLLDRPKG